MGSYPILIPAVLQLLWNSPNRKPCVALAGTGMALADRLTRRPAATQVGAVSLRIGGRWRRSSGSQPFNLDPVAALQRPLLCSGVKGNGHAWDYKRTISLQRPTELWWMRATTARDPEFRDNSSVSVSVKSMNAEHECGCADSPRIWSLPTDRQTNGAPPGILGSAPQRSGLFYLDRSGGAASGAAV